MVVLTVLPCTAILVLMVQKLVATVQDCRILSVLYLGPTSPVLVSSLPSHYPPLILMLDLFPMSVRAHECAEMISSQLARQRLALPSPQQVQALSHEWLLIPPSPKLHFVLPLWSSPSSQLASSGIQRRVHRHIIRGGRVSSRVQVRAVEHQEADNPDGPVLWMCSRFVLQLGVGHPSQ